MRPVALKTKIRERSGKKQNKKKGTFKEKKERQKTE